MPMPVDLVDAVVAAIQGGTYSQTLVTAKKLAPIYDREDVTGWTVDVYAGQQTREHLSRSNLWTKTYSVGLIVRTDASGSAADQETRAAQFLRVCQELMDNLGALNLAGVYPIEIEQDDPYDIGKVSESGLMQTTIIIRYKGTI